MRCDSGEFRVSRVSIRVGFGSMFLAGMAANIAGQEEIALANDRLVLSWVAEGLIRNSLVLFMAIIAPRSPPRYPRACRLSLRRISDMLRLGGVPVLSREFGIQDGALPSASVTWRERQVYAPVGAQERVARGAAVERFEAQRAGWRDAGLFIGEIPAARHEGYRYRVLSCSMRRSR